MTGLAVDPSGNTLAACGIVIPPRDRVAMTEAITLLVNDPDRFEWYSHNSTARIEGLYRMELTLEQYFSIFDELGIDASVRIAETADALTTDWSDEDLVVLSGAAERGAALQH